MMKRKTILLSLSLLLLISWYVYTDKPLAFELLQDTYKPTYTFSGYTQIYVAKNYSIFHRKRHLQEMVAFANKAVSKEDSTERCNFTIIFFEESVWLDYHKDAFRTDELYEIIEDDEGENFLPFLSILGISSAYLCNMIFLCNENKAPVKVMISNEVEDIKGMILPDTSQIDKTVHF
jgi:hypothetical protein